MLKVYGSRLCPDCVRCCADLDREGIVYKFFDFGDDLCALKDFLWIRDNDPQFKEIRANRKIGIPCIVDETGAVSLCWEKYI